MPTQATNLPEYWDAYKPHRKPEDGAPEVTSFEWTQHQGHGPDHTLLGTPRTALELGCAEGLESVYLARQGVEVTGIDFSAAQIARALAWWQDEKRVTFLEAEACAFLDECGETFDAIFSIWGALWFTDPEDLVGRIAKCLNPGGVLAFAQAEPIEGHFGPQAMYGNGFNGRKLTLLRWNYPCDYWTELLKTHGFNDVDVHVLAAPDEGHVGTLIGRAVR